ncbi:MAG: protein kinase [Verrucomicrobiia bacterium]|jgi:serine/threonine-protein kinase
MRKLIGARIGDYDIEAEIGRGAMGVVYRARQVSLNRFVALKVLPAHLAEDAAFIERFKHEAQAAAALNHPNIVHVYAAGTQDFDGETFHYFAMEYVEGQTLHNRLRDEGRLEPDEALAISVYLAEALDHTWQEAHIIHRDIKPSNIFLSKKGAVKLGDLGLAKSVGDAGQSLTQGGTVVGTAYYMSPEQARGDKDIDFRSDIYNLGCTLYQMLSGRYPYEGNGPTVMAKHLTEPPPAILKVLPSCPVPAALMLDKMLAKNRAERQSSYAQLIKELRRAYEKITSGVVEAGVSPAMPAPTSAAGNTVNKPRRTSPAILYTIMGTTAVILLAGALVWAPWEQSEQQQSNSEAAKVRSAPVTQTLLSAAAASPQEQPKPASEAGQQSGAGVSPAQSSINGQAGRLSHSEDRGAEAAPTFQKSAIVPTDAPTSMQPPAGETPALPAKSVAQVAQATSQPASSPVPAPATPAAQPSAPQPADEAFVKSVSAMPPEQQVQAVIAKLKELNPAFDGKETHKIESGAVTTLSFSTVGVTDISPVKALRWLRTLNITPPMLNQKGSLENLAPLAGMQLTWLWCHNNPITDLSPLKGMPLTTLSLGGTQVTDLSPLAGMKLQVLSFNDTVVSELGPLEGMPLTVLWCNNTKVADLSPVKATPLREIKCDFVAERDAAVLRGIRTLAKINDLPVGTFWMRVGPVAATATAAANVGGTSASRPTGATPPQLTMPTSAPSGLSAKKQIEQFVAKMKNLNPDWDGKVEEEIAAGKVTHLKFSVKNVNDITAVSALKELRTLICDANWGENRSHLKDVSPVAGLKLTELGFPYTEVSDISALKGLPLKRLSAFFTRVTDLTPLSGMRLEKLNISGTRVTDLAPLQGMPLTELNLENTDVTELSPIKKAPLEMIYCDKTHVTDLSPLKGSRLQLLRCDFVRERDSEVLRSIKTLVTINGLPASEFWKRVKAGESPQVK